MISSRLLLLASRARLICRPSSSASTASVPENVQRRRGPSRDLSAITNDIEEFTDKPNYRSFKGKSFHAILRESKFMQLGDFRSRIVFGEIVHRNHDDIYVDFGCKFPAILKRPEGPDKQKYVIGATVYLKLYDPELAEVFLGETKAITLLEADAQLIGLYDHKKALEALESGRTVPHTKDVKTKKDVTAPKSPPKRAMKKVSKS